MKTPIFIFSTYVPIAQLDLILTLAGGEKKGIICARDE